MTVILCAVCILDPTGEKGEEQRHSYYVLCAACGVLITNHTRRCCLPLLFLSCDVPGNLLYILPNGVAKRVAALTIFIHVCISYVMAQQVIGRGEKGLQCNINHYNILQW